MTAKIKLNFKISEKGSFTKAEDRDKLVDALASFAGNDVELSIQKQSKKRSSKQNAYWFSVLRNYVLPIWKDYDPDWELENVHEYMMLRLGYCKTVVAANGDNMTVRLSSSEFDTLPWEEFMQKARAYLAEEHQIMIPLPNEGDNSFWMQ